MTIPLVYWVMSLGCWVYALKYGDWETRWAFGLFVLVNYGSIEATMGMRSWFGLPWFGFNPLLLAVDAAYFVCLYALALLSRRYWPIWSAGLQLMCVLTHLGPLLDSSSNPRIYRALETVWMAPMLIIMAIGVAKDRRIGRRSRVARHERGPANPA